MSKKKKEKTVFVEGESVVTTTSPYDQYRNIALEYVENIESSGVTPKNSKRRIRLECLKIAAMTTPQGLDVTSMVNTAKRYYQFVKTGE